MNNSPLPALIDDEDWERVSGFAWYLNKKGYVAANVKRDGKKTGVLIHRIIMQTPKGMETDHWDHNKLDNRKKNLRVATCSQNHANTRIDRIGLKSSQFKGVSMIKGKWSARIMVNRKGRSLGVFNSEIEAAKAYNLAAIESFGEFALTNPV